MQMRAQGPLCRFRAEGGLRSHTSAHERASLPGRARCISATTALATGQCQKQCERASDEEEAGGEPGVGVQPHGHGCLRGMSWPPAPAIPLTERRHNVSLTWLSHLVVQRVRIVAERDATEWARPCSCPCCGEAAADMAMQAVAKVGKACPGLCLQSRSFIGLPAFCQQTIPETRARNNAAVGRTFWKRV